MNPDLKALLSKSGKMALAVALLAGATGAAFAGWLNNADEIFMSVAEAGLSWCM